MATIIYGISGEGSGHSSRSAEMMRHLLDRGHRVKAVSYDRGYRNLCDEFDVLETAGLHITTIENKVSNYRTVLDNLRRLPELRSGLDELRGLFRKLRPDFVITDFEPMTAYLARRFEVPLITLDNQHRMRFMEFPCPAQLGAEALVTQTVIRAMIPAPDVSLVTTFFFGPVKNARTFLFPPILRREVLERRPAAGDHVLVYFTQRFGSFLEQLQRRGDQRFVVYGMDRDDTADNLEFRRFSREGFLSDLAAARAVIATAGFTLISESLFLRKPYLALPMKGQFEQALNAHLLEHLGYGIDGRDATDETITRFLERLPGFVERLEAYVASDNREIKAKLDELLG